MEASSPALPGGGSQSTNIIQNIEVLVTKQDGTDRKLVAMKVASIKAMMNVAGQLMTYDSADPAMSQPQLQQAFGALVGKSVTAVYDKDDKFVEIIVPEGFPVTPLGAGQAPDGKQLGAMMRESLEAGLPAEALAVGGAYTVERKIDMPPMGSVGMKLKGRLDSLIDHEGRQHAKIITQGTMEMPALPAGAGAAPETKLSGETLFDLDRKVVSRSSVKTDITMNAAGKQITMKQNVVNTLKGIDAAPAPK
jgi:hypothetical protein